MKSISGFSKIPRSLSITVFLKDYPRERVSDNKANCRETKGINYFEQGESKEEFRA
jgi:hypothetical protein